jgi:hypothetical protein
MGQSLHSVTLSESFQSLQAYIRGMLHSLPSRPFVSRKEHALHGVKNWDMVKSTKQTARYFRPTYQRVSLIDRALLRIRQEAVDGVKSSYDTPDFR